MAQNRSRIIQKPILKSLLKEGVLSIRFLDVFGPFGVPPCVWDMPACQLDLHLQFTASAWEDFQGTLPYVQNPALSEGQMPPKFVGWFISIELQWDKSINYPVFSKWLFCMISTCCTMSMSMGSNMYCPVCYNYMAHNHGGIPSRSWTNSCTDLSRQFVSSGGSKPQQLRWRAMLQLMVIEQTKPKLPVEPPEKIHSYQKLRSLHKGPDNHH